MRHETLGRWWLGERNGTEANPPTKDDYIRFRAFLYRYGRTEEWQRVDATLRRLSWKPHRTSSRH